MCASVFKSPISIFPVFFFSIISSSISFDEDASVRNRYIYIYISYTLCGRQQTHFVENPHREYKRFSGILSLSIIFADDSQFLAIPRPLLRFLSLLFGPIRQAQDIIIMYVCYFFLKHKGHFRSVYYQLCAPHLIQILT